MKGILEELKRNNSRARCGGNLRQLNMRWPRYHRFRDWCGVYREGSHLIKVYRKMRGVRFSQNEERRIK